MTDLSLPPLVLPKLRCRGNTECPSLSGGVSRLERMVWEMNGRYFGIRVGLGVSGNCWAVVGVVCMVATGME